VKSVVKFLEANPGAKKYFFNTGWMFAEKGLRLVAGLFIGAYVARYLGPAQYGLLNYVISLVALFSVVATLGMETIVIRELVKNPLKKDVLLGTSLLLKIIGASVMSLLLFVTIHLTESDALTRKLIFITGAGMIFETLMIFDYFFQSRTLSKYVVWSQMMGLVVVSVFRIVLVLNEASLIWFAWSSVLDLVVIGGGLIYFYYHHSLTFKTWEIDWTLSKELLRFSWPLIFSSIAVTIYLRIDQVMIKWMLGDEANGNYGVAVRLSELWNFIPVAICSSLFPAILNARTVSEELYNRRLQWLYDLMVAISVTIAIPMCFLSNWIVILLFGEAYATAGGVMSWYIWASVFVFLGVANGKWIISENLQVFRMVILIVSCVMNIVLNYILIKVIGINGAAVSTLIAYAFAGYFGFLFTKKTRPVFFAMTRSFNPFLVLKNIKLQRKTDL
jgi:O-antigen/teichoic acid export membrane protein